MQPEAPHQLWHNGGLQFAALLPLGSCVQPPSSIPVLEHNHLQTLCQPTSHTSYTGSAPQPQLSGSTATTHMGCLCSPVTCSHATSAMHSLVPARPRRSPLPQRSRAPGAHTWHWPFSLDQVAEPAPQLLLQQREPRPWGFAEDRPHRRRRAAAHCLTLVLFPPTSPTRSSCSTALQAGK